MPYTFYIDYRPTKWKFIKRYPKWLIPKFWRHSVNSRHKRRLANGYTPILGWGLEINWIGIGLGFAKIHQNQTPFAISMEIELNQ